MIRRCLAVAVLVLVLIPAVCPVCDESEGHAGKILITEVQPKGIEGFTVANYGATDVDLKGYAVSDGEGTVTFTETLMLGHSESVTLSFDVNTPHTFVYRPADKDFNPVQIGTRGIVKSGNFRLADTGDDLSLLSPNGRLLDTVCWGNKTAEGWNGDGAAVPSKYRYLVRVSEHDTDTSEDWILSRPGLTDIAFGNSPVFIGDVMPFTFPECRGIPVIGAITSAEKEILVSMYQLTSSAAVSALCERARNGISVTVLLEGTPLSDADTVIKERMLVNNIVDAGGTVRLINDGNALNDLGNRFRYLHSKYAVIDEKTVIVTSENWTDSNFGKGVGNRGWGAAVYSEGYAGFMKNIFLNDSSKVFGDCMDLSELYPFQKSHTLVSDTDYSDYGCEIHRGCEITPILSPDNSYGYLGSLFGNAENRIYAEQMNVGYDYAVAGSESPVSWMVDASSRGVDCRLILDAFSDTGKNASVIDYLNTATEVKAAGIGGGDGFCLTHNKGAISDDCVWLGSVNWTDTSFNGNREAAAIIRSEGVSDYFSEFFLKDWENSYSFGGIKAELTHPEEMREGLSGFIELSISPAGDYGYRWDLYGDGTCVRNTKIPKIVYAGLRPGQHKMTVTVSEPKKGISEELVFEYSVEENNGSGTHNLNGYLPYLAVAALAFAAIAGLLKTNGGGEIKRKRYR